MRRGRDRQLRVQRCGPAERAARRRASGPHVTVHLAAHTTGSARPATRPPPSACPCRSAATATLTWCARGGKGGRAVDRRARGCNGRGFRARLTGLPHISVLRARCRTVRGRVETARSPALARHAGAGAGASYSPAALQTSVWNHLTAPWLAPACGARIHCHRVRARPRWDREAGTCAVTNTQPVHFGPLRPRHAAALPFDPTLRGPLLRGPQAASHCNKLTEPSGIRKRTLRSVAEL